MKPLVAVIIAVVIGVAAYAVGGLLMHPHPIGPTCSSQTPCSNPPPLNMPPSSP